VTLSLLAIAGFLLTVCVVVTVHEFGHYWVARKLGFRVLRFSIGFGRPLWSRRIAGGETEFVIAMVPLGGYVRLLDEREGAVAPEDLPRSFTRRPHWQRIAVLLAGPGFNLAFAILLLTGMLYVTGVSEPRPVLGAPAAGSIAARAGVADGDEITAVGARPVSNQSDAWIRIVEAAGAHAPVGLTLRGADGRTRELSLAAASEAEGKVLGEPATAMTGLGLAFREIPVPPVLGKVDADGPAARAGLRPGDLIENIDGEPVRDFAGLVRIVRAHPDAQLAIQYRREGRSAIARVAVASAVDAGSRIGRIRVSQPRSVEPPPGQVRHVDLGLAGALSMASRKAWDLTRFQATMLWRMVSGEVSVKNLSGPLTIGELAGESLAAGPEQFLGNLVLISLLLAFMNLLPIPILDGGQVVMQAVEWLKGSPLSERAQAAGMQVGVALVVLLVGIALYNDITRLFG
jgi:regulator of sigma E protease